MEAPLIVAKEKTGQVILFSSLIGVSIFAAGVIIGYGLGFIGSISDFLERFSFLAIQTGVISGTYACFCLIVRAARKALMDARELVDVSDTDYHRFYNNFFQTVLSNRRSGMLAIPLVFYFVLAIFFGGLTQQSLQVIRPDFEFVRILDWYLIFCRSFHCCNYC